MCEQVSRHCSRPLKWLTCQTLFSVAAAPLPSECITEGANRRAVLSSNFEALSGSACTTEFAENQFNQCAFGFECGLGTIRGCFGARGFKSQSLSQQPASYRYDGHLLVDTGGQKACWGRPPCALRRFWPPSVYLQTVVPVRLLAIFDRLAPLFGAELSSDPQNQCDTCPLSVLG